MLILMVDGRLARRSSLQNIARVPINVSKVMTHLPFSEVRRYHRYLGKTMSSTGTDRLPRIIASH